jgi:acetylornithine deacetylase/succinyl-diaminopimelate desuccinylase-like protein
MDRRVFLQAATGAAVAAAQDAKPLYAQVEKQHDENVQRLQAWIRQPSIAAENRGMTEGCDMMMRLLREAGFGSVSKITSKGQPAVFGLLDAGAPKTIGIYFMYDVKQVDPAEWTSPPWDAALVDRPLGKVVIGRGAVNQKGPQSAVIAALHAFKAAGRRPPVNLALVAEGEEEIGSPNFPEIVQKSEVAAAFRKCSGVYMPGAGQAPDGLVTISLGAKGVIEVELVSSGERWGRGPSKDVHSSNEARIDSPSWHLVQALATLVGKDGHTPAIDGFADKARPISPAEKMMVREAAKRQNEQTAKQLLGISRWVHDVDFLESLELLVSKPTVNIEGLVGGYTGPGGKTVLPHRAAAKLDLRLVPDMTAAGALAALKAHLAKRGFGDIEVNMTGGYDPTSTSPDSALIRAQASLLKRSGIDPLIWPRNAGSWPGYVFTGDPLRVPAGHFGLGHGSGAHGPDEYLLIEPKNPKVRGYDGAVGSHIDYLFELAAVS